MFVIALSTTSYRAAFGHSGPVSTGTLILSRYAKKGRTLKAPYDPYSLLRSVEDLFDYTPLVQAAKAKSFVATGLASSIGS